MSTYLQALTIRLGTGLGNMPEAFRQRHGEYLKSVQRPDGGFAGREGESDLYYTGFALRSLAILGGLCGPLATRAADFLRQRLTGQEAIVDFLSLIYSSALLESSAGIDIFAETTSDWRGNIATALERLRRDDGGYAKGELGVASSTYHTFLVILCLQLIDRPVPDPDRVVQFLLSQEATEGGFHEIRASKRAGTNPTAAAIGALTILNALTDDIRDHTIDFLLDMQTDEGGLRANTRIPIADLLSSFTGLLTLQDVGGFDELERDAVANYVHSLEQEEGGFHGAAWDSVCDVEYTFYGLGCQALLTQNIAS